MAVAVKLAGFPHMVPEADAYHVMLVGEVSVPPYAYVPVTVTLAPGARVYGSPMLRPVYVPVLGVMEFIAMGTVPLFLIAMVTVACPFVWLLRFIGSVIESMRIEALSTHCAVTLIG